MKEQSHGGPIVKVAQDVEKVYDFGLDAIVKICNDQLGMLKNANESLGIETHQREGCMVEILNKATHMRIEIKRGAIDV